MTYASVAAAIKQNGLSIYGGFHGDTSDGLPKYYKTLLLLGPSPAFWPYFKTTPEYQDSAPDPIDRWSTRILTTLATKLNAMLFLPYGGPPYAPFLTWATKTGRTWSSPVGMLVHDTTGLMVSFRGALAFRDHIALPTTRDKPCDTCKRPCLTACPVDALSTKLGYNTDACHTHLSTPEGQSCISEGCLARRKCPVSAGANRTPEQSAHHMSYFHKAMHS